MKHSLIALAIGATILMTGCDNAAKVSSTKTDAEKNVSTQPITIGYSDYPGWVAWQIAIEKGWLKEAGLNVDFKWFDYSASLSAFSAKQIDAVTVTNGDNLVLASGGTNGVLVMATSYSAGNDAVIAKPGINSLQDLKGKNVALEKGFVDHLLFNTGLKDAGIPLSDVKISNALTNELPQVFASPDVAAVVAWQPVASQALKAVPGSKIIYSSEAKPGLIFDAVSVHSEHLMQNKEEWAKILKVWDKVVAYIDDPATHADAVRIMSTKVSIDSKDYETFMKGTHFLNIKENKEVFVKSTDIKSIYGSTYNVNTFNVEFGVYDQKVDVDKVIYPAIVNSID